jgi:Holliday junction resolvasome RuvABC ATP-dependent DNA helicase subunit
MEYEPLSFDQFVGQDKIKRELKAMLSTKDSSSILFRGNFGSGKTTLARIYAKARGNYTYQPTPTILSLDSFGIQTHIIDEVHLAKNFEVLFDEMKYCTYLFCTTDRQSLPDAFLSRCVEFVMQEYSQKELGSIIWQFVTNADIDLTVGGIDIIANRARGVPRIAIQLTKRLHNLSKYENSKLTPEYVSRTLETLNVFSNGIIQDDKDYLEILAIANNPVSLATLSSAINRNDSYVKEQLESFLINRKYISITPRGENYYR